MYCVVQYYLNENESSMALLSPVPAGMRSVHGISCLHDRLSSAILPHNETILRSWCRTGDLETAIQVLQQTSAALSSSTYISLLQLCTSRKALSLARRVHAHLIQHHVQVIGFLADYLVMSLAKCGGIEEARILFAAQPRHTVFSWTALISATVNSACGNEALKMYLQMLEEGVEPSDYTFVSLFKACAISQDLDQGRNLHADAYKRGLRVRLWRKQRIHVRK